MRRNTTLPAIVTLSPKHQLTLPRAALEAIGVKPGDQLTMTARPGALELRRVGPSVAEQTAGSLARYVRRTRRNNAP